MPKLKVHSGTKSRVKISKTKKVLAGSSNQNHFKSKQSAARKRRLAGTQTLGSTNAKILKKRIGV